MKPAMDATPPPAVPVLLAASVVHPVALLLMTVTQTVQVQVQVQKPMQMMQMIQIMQVREFWRSPSLQVPTTMPTTIYTPTTTQPLEALTFPNRGAGGGAASRSRR